ncbi:MAG TPA: OmpA family protein [Candidatus Binataceae bacterium]|nr:OmpA family protein [Candidatus Binataceae bacterium]
MPTRHRLYDAAKYESAPLRLFHSMPDEDITRQHGRSWHSVRVTFAICAGAVLLCTTSGCLATRGWVNGQLNPIKGQLTQTDAKADQALSGLQNLHLEKKLVLNSSNGPTFAFGSAALTDNAKRQIDGFFEDFEGSGSPAPASERVFVVAGYTDNVGPEDYNYELGQRRADRVAGYLVGNEGVDPTQIRSVSYGPSHPIADNSTASGRRINRRVEILVYQEKIATGT